MIPRRYMLPTGLILYVRADIGGHDYMTAYDNKSTGRWRRYKSSDLPPRTSRDAAQVDLDNYAKHKGLREIDD